MAESSESKTETETENTPGPSNQNGPQHKKRKIDPLLEKAKEILMRDEADEWDVFCKYLASEFHFMKIEHRRELKSMILTYLANMEVDTQENEDFVSKGPEPAAECAEKSRAPSFLSKPPNVPKRSVTDGDGESRLREALACQKSANKGPGGSRLREALTNMPSEGARPPSSPPSTSHKLLDLLTPNTFNTEEENEKMCDGEEVDVEPFVQVIIKEEVKDMPDAEEIDEELFEEITIKEELEDILDEEGCGVEPFECVTVKEECEDHPIAEELQNK